MIQDLTSILRYQHQILYPDTEPAWEIDAWFNGEDHARFTHLCIGTADITLLVIRLTDEVAQTMVEVFPVTSC
jgi:hypothetical protein